MATIALHGMHLDEEGFFIDPHEWNLELAELRARQMGIPELSEAHWTIIFHIRQHYLLHGSLPSMSHICRAHHLDRQVWRELFQHGPTEAWKIAGLPDPGEEARAYMANEDPRPLWH
jgi:dissimilatory sulfite reductase related protein